MAHSHYVLDLFFQQGSDPDRYRHEVLRIDGNDDDAALAEGRRVDAWRKPDYFVVRAIKTTARNHVRELYDSRSAHATSAETAQAAEPAEAAQ